ncbi:hypothetical protein GJ496_008186 [Pomphorhynchus laevis]|nr:hypothetical protein GJ496_008186 [Pomphorhynchus laevis]
MGISATKIRERLLENASLKLSDACESAKAMDSAERRSSAIERPYYQIAHVSLRDVNPGCDVKGQESDAAEATKSTSNEDGEDMLEGNLIDAEREEKETACEGDVAEEAHNVTKRSGNAPNQSATLNDSQVLTDKLPGSNILRHGTPTMAEQIDYAYKEVIHWTPNIWLLLKCNASEEFVDILSSQYEMAVNDDAMNVGLKSATVICLLLLQKSNSSKTKVIRKCLERRLLLWKHGGLGISDPSEKPENEYIRSMRMCEPSLAGISGNELRHQQYSLASLIRAEKDQFAHGKLANLTINKLEISEVVRQASFNFIINELFPFAEDALDKLGRLLRLIRFLWVCGASSKSVCARIFGLSKMNIEIY